MRTFLLSLVILVSQLTNAQVYISPQGKVHFHSSAPVEDIDAVSSEGECIINSAGNKVTARVAIKSFVFPKALMQEHFNQNYLESDKFPFATLETTIKEPINLKKDGSYKVTLKGTFEIHGVKRACEIPGTLVIKNGQPYSATAAFDIKLVDYNIKVPTAVVMKIAEVIKVDVNFIFNKQG